MVASSLSPGGTERRQFQTLNGLRGIAAILVAALHYNMLISPISIGSAYLAVDIFFVMSGFVLAYAYESKLGGSVTIRRFITLRIIRLYPLYLLGILLGTVTPFLSLVLNTKGGGWTWSDILTSLLPATLMLPRPPSELIGGSASILSGSDLYPLNPAAWSLFFEIIINIVYAATLRFPQRYFISAVLLVSGLALIGAFCAHGTISDGSRWPEWWVGTARVNFSFFLGVFFYRAYLCGWLPKLSFPPILALAALAILMSFVPPDGWFGSLYDLACVFFALPLLVWLCICNEPRRGGRIFSVLGLVSYPLYLIHIPVLFMINRAVDRLFHVTAGTFAPWIGLAAIGTLILASWVLASTYDVWARRWLTRLAGFEPAPSAARRVAPDRSGRFPG